MNFSFPPATAPFVKCADCHATLGRLIANLGGFLYRRRHDPGWTMDFVSAGCRDITGYDPHCFIGNARLAFGDLIARSDWERVNERVRLAILHRQRATMEYWIRTAPGGWVQVEDRFTPVVNAAGKVFAIEGIVDRVRRTPAPAWLAPAHPDVERLAVLCNTPSLN
jgi:PAS domain-containing protein